MAGTQIRGITIELGADTSGISKALGDVNRDINDTQKQLRDVERLLKLDPKNTELLAQKQKLLSQAIEDTKKKLEAVKKAEKLAQEQFEKGDIAEKQYDAIKREVQATTAELKRLEDAAEDAQKAASKIHQAFDNISTGAQNVSEKAKSVSTAFAPVTAGVTALAAAAYATVPGTEELRSELAALDLNAKENAVNVDAAREAWETFAVQSNDTASAVEGVSNLLQAGFTESNLQQAVEGLAGAALRFPDTLKIESLADSLQETIATGEATGAFGELLDRLGVGAANFSEQMALCSTEAERQNLALQVLADQGLNSTYAEWKKNNEAMVENREANLELQQSMAKVADKILPIVTKVTNKVADAIDWFMSLDEETQNMIITIAAFLAAISPVAGAIGGISDAISFLIANPIVALVAAIVALVALIATKGDESQAALQKLDNWLQNVFAKDWTQVFGPVLGNALNSFFANAKNFWDSLKKILDGIIDFIRGTFTGDWQRAWNGVKEIFSGIVSGLAAVFKTPLNGIISMINGAISGINTLIRGVNKIPGVNIGTIGSVPYLAKGGILYDGTAVVGEAGPEILTVDNGRAVVQPLNSGTSTSYNNSFGGITLNVYGAPGQDVDELANAVADRFEHIVQQKGAVFA